MAKAAWITRFSLILVVALTVLLLLGIFLNWQKSSRRAGITANTTSSLPANKPRIVSMAPNLTEILFALGLEQEIVAVTNDSDFPPPAINRTKIGTFWQPDIEAIFAARPTLVVSENFSQQAELAKRLEKSGCKTLQVSMNSFADLYKGIESIGAAVNRTQQAQKIVMQIKSRQNAYHRKFNGRAAPRILWVIQREPLRVAGVDTFVDEMIRICGGRNAIGKTIHQYPPINQETLLASSPDIIIEPADTAQDYQRLSSTAEDFYGHYPSLPAVRDKRIYVLDGDLVSRLGPRIEKGLMELAKCIWPQERLDNE